MGCAARNGAHRSAAAIPASFMRITVAEFASIAEQRRDTREFVRAQLQPARGGVRAGLRGVTGAGEHVRCAGPRHGPGQNELRDVRLVRPRMSLAGNWRSAPILPVSSPSESGE